MKEPLRERMKGRWHGVLPSLGVPAAFLSGKHQACPMCGGKDRARFDNKEGAGTFFCTHCGAGDGMSLVMKINGWDFKTAAQRIEALMGDVAVREAKPRADVAKQMLAMRNAWGASQPIGRMVRRYLFNRGIEPGDVRDIREAVAACEMRALVRDTNGNGCQVHRTLLTPDGDKREGNCRLFMAGPIPKGSAVRLFSHTDRLGIAEGIETALSAAILFGVPCWAALNTSLLKQWEPPSGVKHVTIFGDSDAEFAGQAAAYELARRLIAPNKGVQVSIEIPSSIGADWNDVLRQRAAGTQQIGSAA
jgi:putative DNA primase/helicase